MSAPTTYLHVVDWGKLNRSMSFTQEFPYMTEQAGTVVMTHFRQEVAGLKPSQYTGYPNGLLVYFLSPSRPLVE